MLGESRWRRKRKSRPQRDVLTPCPVLFALATPGLLGNHGAGPRVPERIILQKGGGPPHNCHRQQQIQAFA